MGIRSTLQDTLRALLGVSAYQPPGGGFGPQLSDEIVEKVREAQGGNIQPLPQTKLRWYLADIETAQEEADSGNMRQAALLSKAMQRDGTLQGLRKSRTKGVTRLPKRFYGNEDVAATLKAKNGSRSVFDEMFPPSELEAMAGDALDLQISVGELLPVPGRSYPVLCRLEPQFLQYRWNENRWYFNSSAGALPITPGDGRWILHITGNRLTPWSGALWPALGTSFVNKEHAKLYRSNYCAKLANPARLAYAPAGATEAQRLGFFQKILAWGVNTVLELPPGWEAKLLESNGRGWDVFQKQIDTSDLEYMISVAGQIITTKGGTGFDGQDVAEGIRQDLIQDDADKLAYTINTQGLPQFILSHWGEEALESATCVEWDSGTTSDKSQETQTLMNCAQAIAQLTTALAPYGKSVNITEMCTRYSIPSVDGAVLDVVMPALGSTTGAAELKTAPPPEAEAASGDGGGGSDDDEEDAA